MNEMRRCESARVEAEVNAGQEEKEPEGKG